MYDEKKIEDSLNACKEAKTIYDSDFFHNPRNVFDLDTYLPVAQEEQMNPRQSLVKSPDFEAKLQEAIDYGMKIRRDKGLPTLEAVKVPERTTKPYQEKEASVGNMQTFSFDDQEEVATIEPERQEPKEFFRVPVQRVEEVEEEEAAEARTIDLKSEREKQKAETVEKKADQEKDETPKDFIELKKKRTKRTPEERQLETEQEEEAVQERGAFKTFLIRFVQLVACVAIAYGLAFLFNQYVGTHTIVDGTSMETTLQDGDVLAVNKFIYRFYEPKQFDIIVFPYDEDSYYIKRIIATPGQTVEIRNGVIYIDDMELHENYQVDAMEAPDNYYGPVTLGDDEYFVLGDNRNHSIDSRSDQLGLVKRDQILGRAFLRMYPFENFGFIN